MGKAPPADGAKRHVLRPNKEQQQTEDALDVDRHQKKRTDVERHLSVNLPVPEVQNPCPLPRIDARRKKLMNADLPDDRKRTYGFELIANVATIAAIRLKFPFRMATSARFHGLVAY